MGAPELSQSMPLGESLVVPQHVPFAEGPSGLGLGESIGPEGRYQILESIPTNTNATELFKVLDWETGEERALKAFNEHDEYSRVAVTRELRVMRAMNGTSGTLPTHDMGVLEAADGQERRFAVMDLADGTVDDEQFESPAERAEIALKVLRDIAPAARVLHEKGLVHRDITPNNILRKNGRYFLGDWGLVEAAVKPEDLSDDVKSPEGTDEIWGRDKLHKGVYGSPAFVPSEALQDGSVSPKVDSYAIGVTVFNVATGELPFATIPGQFDVESYMRSVISEEPVPLSVFNKAASREFSRFNLTLLASDPNERASDRQMEEQADSIQALAA